MRPVTTVPWIVLPKLFCETAEDAVVAIVDWLDGAGASSGIACVGRRPDESGVITVSAVIFHFNPADQTEMIMLMKNLAMAGGFLALSVAGAGGFSIDGRR